jgi:hypothetical protein
MDMIFSQAVLEHVEDLPAVYRALHQWLHPEGFMSHQIDFGSHGLTKDWNGHWTIGDRQWRLIRGTRPYLINRIPYSGHLMEQQEAGFAIVTNVITHRKPLPRESLSERFKSLTDDDLSTASAFLQSVPNTERHSASQELSSA